LTIIPSGVVVILAIGTCASGEIRHFLVGYSCSRFCFCLIDNRVLWRVRNSVGDVDGQQLYLQ